MTKYLHGRRSQCGYLPALVIGLGGVGLRALRYMQSVADSGLDPQLAEMLKSGKMQLLGIDLGDQDNIPEVLNTAFFEPRQTQPEQLSNLKRRWICLDRGNLKTALQQRQYQKPSLDWLPASFPQTAAEFCTYFANTCGAFQNRPLGRYALWRQLRRVYEELQECIRTLNHQTAGAKPQVHLITALGGGTGSGTFWDLLFLMHRIDPELEPTCFFLLPNDQQDNYGKANAYAALWEIEHYRNWATGLPLHYPMAASPWRPPAKVIHKLYLFQNFGSDHKHSDPKNLVPAILSKKQGPYRIAEAVLGHLRAEVHQGFRLLYSDLRHGLLRNNLAETYTFATTTCMLFFSPNFTTFFEYTVQKAKENNDPHQRISLKTFPGLDYSNSPANLVGSLAEEILAENPNLTHPREQLLNPIAESLEKIQSRRTSYKRIRKGTFQGHLSKLQEMAPNSQVEIPISVAYFQDLINPKIQTIGDNLQELFKQLKDRDLQLSDDATICLETLKNDLVNLPAVDEPALIFSLPDRPIDSQHPSHDETKTSALIRLAKRAIGFALWRYTDKKLKDLQSYLQELKQAIESDGTETGIQLGDTITFMFLKERENLIRQIDQIFQQNREISDQNIEEIKKQAFSKNEARAFVRLALENIGNTTWPEEESSDFIKSLAPHQRQTLENHSDKIEAAFSKTQSLYKKASDSEVTMDTKIPGEERKRTFYIDDHLLDKTFVYLLTFLHFSKNKDIQNLLFSCLFNYWEKRFHPAFPLGGGLIKNSWARHNSEVFKVNQERGAGKNLTVSTLFDSEESHKQWSDAYKKSISTIQEKQKNNRIYNFEYSSLAPLLIHESIFRRFKDIISLEPFKDTYFESGNTEEHHIHWELFSKIATQSPILLEPLMNKTANHAG